MNDISSIIFTKQQICNFLVLYQHLCDDTCIEDKDKIVGYIRRSGCIQYDPLDVVGRNPDLVLQSRCKDYKKGDIDSYLYEDRVLFDVWDKNMSISAISDWAYFKRFRTRYLEWCSLHKEAVDEITGYLQVNDSACSSDFNMEDRVKWHYGPQRLAKAALECMCYAGFAVVHHKKGARRYYGLAERFVPEEYYNMDDPNITDEEYFKWFVLRRINSIGVLWNRPGDAWLGMDGFKSVQRGNAFKALLDDGKIIEITVEGIKNKIYIAAENLKLLKTSADSPVYCSYARILAPLDNMLWDRKLIMALFDFEYRWEVYTPAADRKYGYYVLPVLCGNKFIGRIEMETDKKSRTLIIKNIWYEDKSYKALFKNEISSGLDRFREYNLCDKVIKQL